MISDVRKTSLKRQKVELRRLMRARRAQVTASFHQAASREICRLIQRQAIVLNSNRIALYAATGNEVDLQWLSYNPRFRKKEFYYPKIGSGRNISLNFVAAKNRFWQQNRYGIMEPYSYRAIPVWTLDIVLMPLLAVDSQGGRLGMGAGYYDRAFAFCRSDNRLGRTILVGVGYGFQQVEQLPCEEEDVRVDYVVTEQGFYPIGSSY